MNAPSPGPSVPTAGPELDRLRQSGWAVGNVVGRYCVAWRGAEEIVLQYDAGQWRVVNHRTTGRLAA